MIDLYTIKIGIHLSNYNIYFKKAHYSIQEVELAKCIGMTFQNGVMYGDIRCMSKISIFEFMKLAFPNFTKSEDFKQQREVLYTSLKNEYEKSQKEFDLFCEENVHYYSKFYNHQKEGVLLGVNRFYNILSFEQGLGKTITSIAISELCCFDCTIIVAPSACKWNWLEDMTNWGVDANKISVIDSKKSITGSNEKFVIINYDIFEKYIKYLLDKKPKHLILDECHKVKNYKANRTKAIKKFVKESKCKVTFLSGTPSPNRTMDIFSYLNIIDHPLGYSYHTFTGRFCEMEDTGYGKKVVGSKNTELFASLISNFLLRKLKSQCLDLPDKNYIKLFFGLDDYKEMYEMELNEFKKSKKKGSQKDTGIALARLNIITTKAKIKHIKELVDNINEEEVKTESGEVKNKKAVVFTSYKEPLETLYGMFDDGEALFIDGSVDSRKRLDIVNEFKSSSKVKVLIANITAGGIGLNIVSEEIQDVIFMNFPFTQAELDQAIDRLHRIGQKNKINIYYTICKNSIDEKLLSLIDKKYKDVSLLIDRKLPEFDFDAQYISDIFKSETEVKDENEIILSAFEMEYKKDLKICFELYTNLQFFQHRKIL